MKAPDKIGRYYVEVFSGERSDPYMSEAYWDGTNWKIDEVYGCTWPHNLLVLSFCEIKCICPDDECLLGKDHICNLKLQCGQEKIF